MTTFFKENFKFLAFASILLFGIFTPKTYSFVPALQLTNKVVDMKQIICMANNIFYEAGSESRKGQAAVAHVVLNRVRHGFGSNPCKVINQVTQVNDKKVCQFSWVCENKGPPNKRDARYVKALQTAYEVMVMGMHKDVIPRSALFFHNLTVQPNWPHRKVAEIGNHVFYSKIYKK
jgi:spore germination cell wall hydrolase CwlJ-like protein